MSYEVPQHARSFTLRQTMKHANYALCFGIVSMLVCGYLRVGNFMKEKKIVKETKKQYAKKIRNLEKEVLEREATFANYSNSKESSNCSTFDIVIISGGINATREVTVLIKSILFNRKNPLHVHFVADKISQQILTNLFRTWNIQQLKTSFYSIEKLKPTVDWIPTGHYSGNYGLMKLAVTSLLPKSVKRIIVLDTDLVFLCDIAGLWEQFKYFKPSHAIGLVENQSEWYTRKLYKNYRPWPALGKGFNTGVMLMDCEKMHKLQWMDLWHGVAEKVLKFMETTALADQDIINTVITQHPTIVYQLPCVWNVQLSMHSQADKCYKGQMGMVRVVHWNSPLKRDVPIRNNKYFRSMYEKFVEYSGNLLTIPLTNCMGNTDYDENDYSYDTALYSYGTALGYCQDLISKASHLHRTHIFFLPCSYSTKTKNDVTLVLQLSIDRLQALHNIAANWDGPISVAIFLSDSDVPRILNFVGNSEVLRSSTKIGYHVVYKNFDESVYPINLLRNEALKHVETEFVFTCDIDFVPSVGIYKYLVNSLLPHYNAERKNAYIVPAFESFQYKNNFPKTKSELGKKLNENTIFPFRIKEWPRGHNATDFKRWKTASEVYQASWVEGFEPYVVVRKSLSPKYDERFVGFGWNKVSYTYELNKAGFRFLVLPSVFILHLPHSPSIDISKFRNSVEYRKCMASLKKKFVDEIDKKYQKHLTPKP